MWFYIISICFLTIVSNHTNAHSNIEQTLSTISAQMLQFLNNSLLNSSVDDVSRQVSGLLTNTSLEDLQNDNNTQQLQIRFRERKRQERLLSIQSQILQRLGINGRNANSSTVERQNSSLSDEERDLMNRVVQVSPTPRTRTVTGVNEISSSEIFAERLQSFYPSCSVPNHTDALLWAQNTDTEMKLYYDITFPRSLQSRHQVTAVSAKLRIFKFNDPPNERINANHNLGNTVSDRIYQMSSQEGLTVSLYQYMRPLRQNRREKKRLVDSRTIAWNKRGYIEFNVINAINYWQNNPIRNFGLFVEIENPYGVRYNPQLYFTQMNCSTVQNTPIPNLAQIYPEMDNESSILNSDSFPTLDLLTVETIRQVSASNTLTTSSLRQKRLAIRSAHMDSCQTIKTVVSMKDLKLENTVLYPTSLEMVTCRGICHKHLGNHYECKPSDYKDIKFVFLNQNSNPKIKKLKDFIPQSCRCIKTNRF